jgi:quinolinate synthase
MVFNNRLVFYINLQTAGNMGLIESINKLKKEKNAVVLAHCYQNVEIDEVADFVGDSLYLSRVAAATDADLIVFAGVYFMAQTAKILSPQKKVLLPRMESGCLMADMLDVAQLREFKAKHPGVPTVCYVNSTAEVKAECDICCTSSNAVRVVKSLGADKVLFMPDTYLGKWVEAQLGDVQVITYPGFCPTHLRIRPEDVIAAREQHPGALVLTHPECHQEVCKMSDFVGSTSQIMDFAAKSDNKSFIIATEKGVVERLQRDHGARHCEEAPGADVAIQKEFHLIKEDIVCPNMKWHTLHDIYNALEREEHEITVDENVAAKARTAIERML